MPDLRAIRTRIASVKNTQQITRAMKMVAAAKLRKAQEAIITLRPYAYRLGDVISQLASRADFSDHPLLAQPEPKRVELVVLTSDRGLCGGFNANINRTAEKWIAERVADEANEYAAVNIIGRKGHEYFKRRDVEINSYFREVLTDVGLTKAGEITEDMISRFVDHGLDAMYVVYNEFKSAISQKVVIEQMLPVVPTETAEEEFPVEFIYEPSKEDIMDAVLPRHLTVQMYRMLLESVASEMGARMSAMDAATKNAGELIDKLTMQFNRTRQMIVTTEIGEIIGGAEALKG